MHVMQTQLQHSEASAHWPRRVRIGRGLPLQGQLQTQRLLQRSFHWPLQRSLYGRYGGRYSGRYEIVRTGTLRFQMKLAILKPISPGRGRRPLSPSTGRDVVYLRHR